jgi:hypothetical protein
MFFLGKLFLVPLPLPCFLLFSFVLSLCVFGRNASKHPIGAPKAASKAAISHVFGDKSLLREPADGTQNTLAQPRRQVAVPSVAQTSNPRRYRPGFEGGVVGVYVWFQRLKICCSSLPSLRDTLCWCSSI